MKITILTSTLLCSFSLALTACGGGGSSSTTKSNVKHTFDGTWLKMCKYNASTNTADKSKTTFKGDTSNVVVTTYTTSDCSGTATRTDEATFNIKYQGTFPTSTCTAEKVDLKLTAAKRNGASLSKAQIDLVNSTTLYPKYQLLCIDSSGKLRKGDTSGELNGTTADKRPKEMDMSTNSGLIKQKASTKMDFTESEN